MNNEPRLLAWLDLEMTGLCWKKDVIIEAAIIITDFHLAEVSFISLDIHAPKSTLTTMNKWCLYTHNKSGLVQRSLSSSLGMKEADVILCNFIRTYFDTSKPFLCGNCVAQDRKFLASYMPKLENTFSHRILDISSFRIAQEIWTIGLPETFAQRFRRKCRHRALFDLRDTIQEMKMYRVFWRI